MDQQDDASRAHPRRQDQQERTEELLWLTVRLTDAVRKMKPVADFTLRLRIAVHAGEPLVEGDDLLGHDDPVGERMARRPGP